MKTNYFKKITYISGIVSALTLIACHKELDQKPFIGKTSDLVFDSPQAYKESIAKVYAGLALTGQKGPDGNGDLGSVNEGFSSYLRQYWSFQELTTDEAVIAWNDAGIKDFHSLNWDASNPFIKGLYYRVYYQIPVCNEFIRESAESKLEERNIPASDRAEIANLKNEARFLRALSYWHALDLFNGQVPFVTETDKVGSFNPKQTNAKELFAYVESELKDLENVLKAPRQNEYARVDKASAWMLLAKLYLNAEVYGQSNRYTDAGIYAKKVIDAGYTLEPKYDNLFKADNQKSKEIIFPIAFDGVSSQSWGGMTFLIHAPVGGSMPASEWGIDGGWGGIRTTKALVQKFTNPKDKRGTFYSNGQDLEINDVSKFTDGYGLAKFKNITSTGTTGKNLTHPDTDYPMFRLGDAYLMYAEAAAKGNADKKLAVDYINKLRERAYGDASGNITESDLTLNFILDERAREMHWEGTRRVDLRRHNKFTSKDYLWPWKGGVKDGKEVDAKYENFPIPGSDIIANPNLKQLAKY